MTFIRNEVPRSKLVCPGNGFVAFASSLGWYSSGSGRKTERKKQKDRQRSTSQGRGKNLMVWEREWRRDDAEREVKGGGVAGRSPFLYGLARAGFSRHYTIVEFACPLLDHVRHVGTGRYVNYGSRSSRWRFQEFHRRARYAVHIVECLFRFKHLQ